MRHKNSYRIYEVPQDLINFLRKDGKYKNFSHAGDPQIYSHHNQAYQHSDKYIGIIIEFQNQLYFAPLTHDGNKTWLMRDDTYDFEMIYDSKNKYAGSVLLCKALPLTHGLAKFVSLGEILEKEGKPYFLLCQNELNYLNSPDVHDKIQSKMQACVYGKESLYKEFRVDYELAIENVKKYNELIERR